jgi:hypothetical protein
MNHFLDLWPIPSAELRSILNNAKSRKAARKGLPKGTADKRRAACRPHAGDDLREELDAHARLVSTWRSASSADRR